MLQAYTYPCLNRFTFWQIYVRKPAGIVSNVIVAVSEDVDKEIRSGSERNKVDIDTP